jgi:3-dehydrosphinganine reductase
MDYFRQQLVVITGGSSGIGLATAKMLRQGGAHLLVIARNQARLDAAAEELRAITAEGDINTLALDVGDGEAVRTAIAKLPGPRPVNMLINNAGVVMPGLFLDLPQDQFEEMMRINFMGAVHMTRALLPSMLEQGSGHVAFVSSLIGLMGIFGYTAYAASKFAMRGFAEALRCELRPKNIRVSVCSPPDTDTPQHTFELQYQPPEAKAIAGNAKALTADEVAQKLLRGMAAHRFHIVPGGSAHFADVAYRLFPGMVRSMFDSDVRKAQTQPKS